MIDEQTLRIALLESIDNSYLEDESNAYKSILHWMDINQAVPKKKTIKDLFCHQSFPFGFMFGSAFTGIVYIAFLLWVYW